jgi:hypothetical protein
VPRLDDPNVLARLDPAVVVNVVVVDPVVVLVVLVVDAVVVGAGAVVVVGAVVVGAGAAAAAAAATQPPQGTSVLPVRLRSKRTPLMCAAMSAAQNELLLPYSALNTALFAAVNTLSVPHSLYWLHCSSSAQSKYGWS